MILPSPPCFLIQATAPVQDHSPRLGIVRCNAYDTFDLAGMRLRHVHHRLGVADPRAGIGRRIVLLKEAVTGHADAGDHHDVFLLVDALVCAAVDEAHIADQRDSFLIADELDRDLRRLLRVPGVSSSRYLIGRPFTPPLAFRHLKYAAAAIPDELKLSGPVTLTMPPMTIGSPTAALPVLAPHFGSAA